MPSYMGGWLGSWIGSWLGGSAASTDVVVNVSAVVISITATSTLTIGGADVLTTSSTVTLTAPTAQVTVGADAPTSSSVVTLTAPTAQVTVGADAPTSSSVVTLTAPTAQVTVGADAPTSSSVVTLQVLTPTIAVDIDATTTPVTITISIPAALAAIGQHAVTIPSVMVVSSGTATATGASDVSVTPSDVLLVAPVVQTTLDVLALTEAQIITLVQTDVKVYDYDDAYVPTGGVMVKINIPEILAFSTDITTDMLVVEAMEDDMTSIDGTQAVKLLRKTDNVVIDLVTAQAVPENKIYTFNNALIRQISERDNRAVKQLRQFMQSVQNDDFNLMDTIIELPLREDVKIVHGDVIESDLMGTKYVVIAVDTCTLRTRWRVGARKLT